MRRWHVIFLFIAGLLLGGEEVQNRTSVDGFVIKDVTGAVPGVRVGLDSLTKGFHRETVTDASGHYVFNSLEPGGYSVWAEVAGHGCIVFPHVVATLGQNVRQDFHFGRSRRDPDNCNPLEKKAK